jgi:hypothetical protein
MEFPYAALPGLYHSANDLSVSTQRTFLRVSLLRLVLLVAAAVTGAVSIKSTRGIDVAALLTAVALLGAIGAEGWLIREKPERAWYDGRVLAESVKTLAWRYAMGAIPFPLGLPGHEAELMFVDRLAGLLKGAAPAVLDARPGTALNDTLRGLRNGSLPERRTVYLRDRITEQSGWYAGKSQRSRRTEARWRTALVMIEAAGVTGAVLRATGTVELDVAGIVAAVAGAGVAWLALRKYGYLAQSYAYATNELAIVQDRLILVTDEAGWAAEVAAAEEAITREHLTWRSVRTSIVG